MGPDRSDPEHTANVVLIVLGAASIAALLVGAALVALGLRVAGLVVAAAGALVLGLLEVTGGGRG